MPNTLLLCIFLFCIFLLYSADPQVEVQIRILLRMNIGNQVKMSSYSLTAMTVSQKYQELSMQVENRE